MRRSAFTLFELVLVMFIVTVAAGIGIPLVDAMLNPNQLVAATDTVRSKWEATRNRAMEEGRPYRFSIQEGGSKFKIEADDADVNPDERITIDGELPEPCLFVSSPAKIDDSTKPANGGAYKTIAIFLPDGTAREDVELSFGRAGRLPVTLKLRALTGAVTKVVPEAAK